MNQSLLYKSPTGSLSYSSLIELINTREKISSPYLAKQYPDFILNVIIAIVHNQDIELVDYRNVQKEVETNETIVSPIHIPSVGALIERIKESTSNIGIYSSGTTAEPKLINQSVQRLLKSVRISDDYKNSRWGFTYNPSHSAGIQVFLQVICNEATLFDLYKCSRAEILNTLTIEKITHLSATPTFYRMLAPYDFTLPEIRSITFNGEKSTTALITSITSTAPNARIRNIYGSTESGPLMSSETTTFQIPQRLLENIKVDNDELFIKGHLISRSVNSSDWYPTGDLVNILNDDPLTIEFVSRKTKILNVGGQNVNPQEVEETLLLHPGIKDASVKGRSHRMIGNLIVANVLVLDNENVTERELIKWCRERIASYKVPRMIKFVDEIQVGRTGKKLG